MQEVNIMADNEKKGLIAEFKEFISKGNVMNLSLIHI